MDGCLFCKIVSGDIPCYKVWENDQFLAFLDKLDEEATSKPASLSVSLLLSGEVVIFLLIFIILNSKPLSK
jgi:hypothetical protein